MQFATCILAVLLVFPAFNSATVVVNETENPAAIEKTTVGEPVIAGKPRIVGKPDFTNCTNMTLRSGEYNLLPDGGLHVKTYDIKLETSSFVLWNDSVTICKSSDMVVGVHFDNYAWTLRITELCITLSALCISWCYVTLLDDVQTLINGTYVVLAASLFLMSVHFGIVIFFGQPDCGDLLLRFPAMTHFFILAFLFWFATLVFDLMLCYQKGNEVVVIESGKKRIIERTIIRSRVMGSTLFRLVLIYTVTAIIGIFIETNIKMSWSDDCSASVSVLFTFLLRSVFSYSIVGCLNFLYSQHLLSRQMFSIEKVMIMRNFYETHFALFLMVVLSWLMSCMSVISRLEGFQHFVFALEVFQLCFLLAVLSIKRQFESGVLGAYFKS